MNIFGFNSLDAIISIFTYFVVGVFIGFLYGLVRFVLFAFMVSKPLSLTEGGGDIVRLI